MATKMKGLLKGLRYISNIFEAEEKEHEMQIGFPTDVKHIAHIGWDSPSVGSPSWMNDMRPESSEALSSTAVAAARSEPRASPKSSSRDVNGVGRSSSRGLPAMPLPKPSKRNPSSSAAAGANSDSPRTSRHSRRHQSSVTSPNHDKSESSRCGRRERSATAGSDMSNYASSPLQEQQPAATKQRRRKIKGSSSSGSGSGGGSSKPSRSKAGDGKAVEKELPPVKTTRDDEDEDEG